jgi:hypothetical protein
MAATTANHNHSLIKEVAKQVPALTVLALVVWLFLDHQKEQMAHIDLVSGQCHEVTRDSIATNMALVNAINELRVVVEQIAKD